MAYNQGHCQLMSLRSRSPNNTLLRHPSQNHPLGVLGIKHYDNCLHDSLNSGVYASFLYKMGKAISHSFLLPKFILRAKVSCVDEVN